MKSLIWNIRSVNINKNFERLITMYRNLIGLVGLMELMQNVNKLERYRRNLGPHQALVNVYNKAWENIHEIYEVQLLVDMEQRLTLNLFNTELQKEFIITLVYAKCDALDRIELWDTMYALATNMTVPWLLRKDINVIVDKE